MTNPQMSEAHAPAPLAELPMSVLEVMGDRSLVQLRHHLAGALRACASSAKLRRDAPFVIDDLDAIEATLRARAHSLFGALADAAGMPAEGESLSRGNGAPANGDYRILVSGCWIWLRSLDTKGYPVLGRRTALRHNRPAYLYWMMVNGPIPADMRLVRTCREPHCIAPEHGELVTMSQYGERTTRERSALGWDAVRAIRAAIGGGEAADAVAARYGISAHHAKDIFRNKSWYDAEYTPGIERTCQQCATPFRTTNLVRRYCRADCAARAVTSRARRRGQPLALGSPERRARERERLRRELAAARVEWEPRVDPEVRPTWGPSLDAPLASTDGDTTLHGVVASDLANPVAELEAAYVRAVLGGVTEDAIEDLDDDALLDLRERLIEAGLSPSTSEAVCA